MLDNNKMIITFGLNEEEMERLDGVVKREALPRYIVVTRDMCSMPIKDIIAGLKFEVYDESILDEKVVLFNNFTDEELDKGIKSLRASLTPMPILAVVTPTSIEWTFKNLLEHLIEEREWFRAQKRGTKSE